MDSIQAESDTEVTESDVKAMETAFLSLQANYGRVVEDLAGVQMMLDQAGWAPLTNYGEAGLNKSQLDTASNQLRELVVGNPIIKKGSELRHNYAHDKGFEIDVSSVRTKAAQKRILDWAEATFTPELIEKWSRAEYTDGNFFLVGDERTKKAYSVPITQIKTGYVDPDNHEDVLAFQREWLHQEGPSGNAEVKWYYTDTYDGHRARTLKNAAGQDGVDTKKTILWAPVNRQVGWAWGIPDALPAIAWARLWRQFLENGSTMSAAMAKIAFKLTSKSQGAATAATAQISQSTAAAQTAALSSSMDLAPLASAGKGYDFASGETLLMQVASAISVAYEDLLSKPNTDTATGLPNHVKRAVRARQKLNAAFIKRCLVWMGAPTTITVKFPEIDDMDTFRRAEMMAAAWGTGLFHPEEVRGTIAENAGIVLSFPNAPDGLLIPQNLATVQAGAQVVDTSTDGSDTTTTQSGGGQKADGSNSQSNGQGRDSQGIGQASKGNNDLRDGTGKKK